MRSVNEKFKKDNGFKKMNNNNKKNSVSKMIKVNFLNWEFYFEFKMNIKTF